MGAGGNVMGGGYGMGCGGGGAAWCGREADASCAGCWACAIGSVRERAGAGRGRISRLGDTYRAFCGCGSGGGGEVCERRLPDEDFGGDVRGGERDSGMCRGCSCGWVLERAGRERVEGTTEGGLLGGTRGSA